MDRVLHINDYPADGFGGTEVVLRQTLVLLARAGVSVDSFTCADLPDPTLTAWRYLDNPIARAALNAKLDAFRPTIVHLHNFYHVLSPGILATLADYKQRHGLRVVMTAHDYHLVCPNSGGSWFRWWSGRRETIEPGPFSLPRLAARRWDHRSLGHSLLKLIQHAWHYRWQQRQRVIDLVICPSRFVESMLGSTRLPTYWLPHPVSPPRVAANRAGPLSLVFAGRIEPEKGLDEFLQLLPADFDARLTIIGDGSQARQCEATCIRRGWRERVEFTGRLPHEETLARIAASHVLVQPSRVLETYGLSLIEALASGTNVLAARRGAATEIVDMAGVGYLFEPDDAASLAEQMSAIVRDFKAGTLNRFDILAFLEERGERRYVEELLRTYASEDQSILHTAA